MKKRVFCLSTIALAAGLALSSTALAVDFPETEPNDTKFTGNAVGPMAPGDTISGTTTGTSTTTAGAASADNFLITVAAPPSAGIWRYRLVLSSTIAGHTGSLRALTQTAGVANAGTDTAFQTSSTTTTPARFNQWYGTGASTHQLYYRVTGSATTTAPYTATLERQAVTPDVGPSTIVAGNVRISTIGQTTTDTDLWVYDSNFQPVATFGNDDESIAGGGTGATLQSQVTRTLTPGTYYVAISNFGFSNDQPAPADDDFRTGALMDFANVAANSSTSTAVNVNFAITGGDNVTTPVTATRAGAFDVTWVRFVVVPLTSPTNPSGTGTATPSSVSNSGTGTTTLAVTVTPGQNPTSTAHTVTVTSAALVGGSVTLLDNGVAPDAVAGDNIFSRTATIAAGATPGATTLPFTIQETAPSNRTGSGNISITIIPPPPANDLCSGAITVSTGTTTGDNSQATTDSAASCQTSSNKDVWYSFTATTAGPYRFDTEGSAQADTVLNLFDACGGTELACDDDTGTGLLSTLTFTMTAGQNVKIRVASFGSAPAGGGFNLNINPTTSGACCNPSNGVCAISTSGAAGCAVGSNYLGDNTVCNTTTCPLPPPPANDECANAITANLGTTTGNNAAATTDSAASCQASSNKDVWYSFTAATAGSYQFDTEGSTQTDTVLSLLDVCGGTEIACDDDGGTGLLSSLVFTMTAGQNVKIRVASFGATPAGGAFNLNITNVVTGACCALAGTCTSTTSTACATAGGAFQGANSVCLPNPCPQPQPPTNDTCATAINVVGTASGNIDSVTAQNENAEPNGTCNSTAAVGVDNSIWFSFTPGTSGTLSGVIDMGYDGVAVLYTGTCGSAATLTEVACWDLEPMDLSIPDTGSSALVAGQTYYLVIGDWGVTDGGGPTLYSITVPGGPVTGACCATDGSCSVTTQAACTGTWTSGGTCSPNVCPQPTNGRCCVGARCTVATDAAACTALASGPTGGLAGSVFTSGTTACNATGNFTTPCCYANYNKVGGITVQDIFDFLSGWFSNSPNANVEGTGGAPTVQDIFDFLAAWFSGGCS